MRKLLAALSALLLSTAAPAQIVTNPTGNNTTILPSLIVEQWLQVTQLTTPSLTVTGTLTSGPITSGSITSTGGITATGTISAGSFATGSSVVVTGAAPQMSLGANAGVGGELQLNGGTSGNTLILATATGGISLQPTLGQGIGLYDGTANLVLQTIGAGSSSANYFTVTNANTGVGPKLAVVGTDTNISLNIAPKGTGKVAAISPGQSIAPLLVGGTGNGTGDVQIAGNTSGFAQIIGSATGGHFYFSSSSSPTITSGCGGAGSSVVGTDSLMFITGQTTAVTSCTITFGTAYTTEVFCFPSGQNSAITSWSNTDTAMTVNFASTANYSFSVLCMGF